MRNIILTGMPGAGKSTVGVILAKTLGMNFIDTDIVLQENSGRMLQEIINTDGIDAFLQAEESVIVSLNGENMIIATGGSVVFSEKSMQYLKKQGIIIYLSLSYEEMARRIRNITTRGIVLAADQSLLDLYNQRLPLYEKYADRTIDCSDRDVEKIVENILHAL
ncbi:MAG TPA: shikimate kinase [Methanoregula sp.]|nr:shikimate kinase [Methanoregula sp.]